MLSALRLGVLRTQGTPLRPLWAAAYRVAARLAAAWLRRCGPDVAVYVRGSLAGGEPVYGLSDIDLIAVRPGQPTAPGTDRDAVIERWQRLARRSRLFAGLVSVAAYEREELVQALAAPAITFGLDCPPGAPPRERALFLAGPPERFGNPWRPVGSISFYGPLLDWRLVAGRDGPLPLAGRASDATSWTWLDLQFAWKYALWACAHPREMHAAHHCVKMAARAAWAFTWLRSGSSPGTVGSLRRVARLCPELEPDVSALLSARDRLGHRPEPPLGPALRVLGCVTAQVGAELARRAEGDRTVRLVQGELALSPEDPGRLAALLPGSIVPLCDWRARVLGADADEALVQVAGALDDPGAVGAAALAGSRSPWPVLYADDVLVLPTARRGEGGRPGALLRGAQCPATDPVSFALLDRAPVARFLELPGWAAMDCARRALAEHAVWLERRGDRTGEPATRLALLLSAARAAVFAESVEAGEGELPVTVDAAAQRFCDLTGASDVAVEAVAAHRRAREAGEAPPAALLGELARLLRSHPCFAEGGRGTSRYPRSPSA